MATNDQLIPIGVHKGKPLSLLATMPGYCRWLVSQPWLKREHPAFYQFIINNCAEPQETPEHNLLQTLFLEAPMQVAALKLAGWLPLNPELRCERISAKLRELEERLEKSRSESDKEDLQNQISDLSRCSDALDNLTSADYEYKLDFESGGWDVVISGKVHNHTVSWLENYHGFKDTPHAILGIEIKPLVGDDYPAILRQIKASERSFKTDMRALAYERLETTNVPIETVRAFFVTSGVQIFSFAELKNIATDFNHKELL